MKYKCYSARVLKWVQTELSLLHLLLSVSPPEVALPMVPRALSVSPDVASEFEDGYKIKPLTGLHVQTYK